MTVETVSFNSKEQKMFTTPFEHERYMRIHAEQILIQAKNDSQSRFDLVREMTRNLTKRSATEKSRQRSDNWYPVSTKAANS